MLEVAEEEGDAEHLKEIAKRPDDAVVPEYAGTFWRGWHDLRFDRQYGAFGGESPISFASIDRYAIRYGISNSDFDTFLAVVCGMDEEYLQHVDRVAKAKAEADKTQNR